LKEASTLFEELKAQGQREPLFSYLLLEFLEVFEEESFGWSSWFEELLWCGAAFLSHDESAVFGWVVGGEFDG